MKIPPAGKPKATMINTELNRFFILRQNKTGCHQAINLTSTESARRVNTIHSIPALFSSGGYPVSSTLGQSKKTFRHGEWVP